MHYKKHQQRQRAKTTAKYLYAGIQVHRMGGTYVCVGLQNEDDTVENGYWLIRSGRKPMFYNSDFTSRD